MKDEILNAMWSMATIATVEMKRLEILNACVEFIERDVPERTTDAHMATRASGFLAGYQYAQHQENRQS